MILIGNSGQSLSGHGHTSQDQVSLGNENTFFIYRSSIMNPPNAAGEGGLRCEVCESGLFFFKMHVTYFIGLSDLRVCNKLLVIPRSRISQNKEHNNINKIGAMFSSKK